MRYDLAMAPATSTASRSAWSRSLLLYAALVAVALLLFMGVVRSMATTWWLTTAFNHCAFVPLASIFLAWRRRERLLGMTPRRDLLGIALLALALFGWLAGRAADVMLVQQLALVATFVALFVALFGRRIAWQLAFPLGFLFLMVPFGEGLIPSLQDFTAHFAVRLLRLLDVPVFHDGVLITTPSGLFEVAEACAGLRFLIANVVIALLFAHLAYRKLWKWALFLSIAVIVPILANGVRATAIIYIAFLTDNEYAAGVDHIVYGWVFFALVMILLLVIGNTFADQPERLQRDDPGPMGALPFRSASYVPLLALLLLVAVPAYAATVMGPRSGVSIPRAPALEIGGDWAEVPAGSWRPVFEGADLVLGSSYAKGEDKVDLAIGYYAFQRPGAELVQERNRLADGERWRRRTAGTYELALEGLPSTVRLEELMTADQQRRIVLSWYWVGGHFTANRIEALAWQALDRLLGRDRPAAILAVGAAYETAPDEATRALERFLADHSKLKTFLRSIGDARSSMAGERGPALMSTTG